MPLYKAAAPCWGVPPELTDVIEPGISPSRAIAKRIRGVIMRLALIALIAVTSERTSMTCPAVAAEDQRRNISGWHVRSC